MAWHNGIGRHELRQEIKNRSVKYAGNSRLKKIWASQCSSGKRMTRDNRIFFKTETEALAAGFRPCGHCMPDQYHMWKLTK